MKAELTKYLKAKAQALKSDWNDVPEWVIDASVEFFKQHKDKPLNKQKQITKHFDAYLAGGEDLSYTKIHAALKNALKEKPDYMVESITVRHKGEDVHICLIEDLEYTTVKRFCEMCGI